MKKIYPLLLNSVTPESTALNGFLKDNTLDDLIETYMGNLLGDKVFTFFQGNLPVTVKLSDTASSTDSPSKESLSDSSLKKNPERSLSNGNSCIRVSPDNETALPRYGCWGKERMLYILSAEEDASIWIGFKKNLTASDIYERCQSGTILEAMNEIGPEEGETFYIRPGVPFCIGKGVKYVEVSQNSPVEFNIEELDQLVEALDFIRLDATNPEYVAPEDCLFRMERVAITKPQTIAPDQTESFMVLLNLDNQTSLKVKDLRGYTEISEETCITLDSAYPGNASNHSNESRTNVCNSNGSRSNACASSRSRSNACSSNANALNTNRSNACDSSRSRSNACSSNANTLNTNRSNACDSNGSRSNACSSNANTLNTNRSNACDLSANALNANGSRCLVLIPHDIQELTIAPAQEGENPTSSFLRIYMCNIPEPPKPDEEEEDECDDDNHEHHCGCDAHHHHHDEGCGCHHHDDEEDDCHCGHHLDEDCGCHHGEDGGRHLS